MKKLVNENGFVEIDLNFKRIYFNGSPVPYYAQIIKGENDKITKIVAIPIC